eukprot:557046-Amphidinium_carterae.2
MVSSWALSSAVIWATSAIQEDSARSPCTQCMITGHQHGCKYLSVHLCRSWAVDVLTTQYRPELCSCRFSA